MEKKYILFVFQDVEDESFLKYLLFAKNVVIISQLAMSDGLDQFDYVTKSPVSYRRNSLL